MLQPPFSPIPLSLPSPLLCVYGGGWGTEDQVSGSGGQALCPTKLDQQLPPLDSSAMCVTQAGLQFILLLQFLKRWDYRPAARNLPATLTFRGSCLMWVPHNLVTGCPAEVLLNLGGVCTG